MATKIVAIRIVVALGVEFAMKAEWNGNSTGWLNQIHVNTCSWSDDDWDDYCHSTRDLYED